LFRDGFKTILKKMGRTGVRLHAFRLFRESVLLASDARQILMTALTRNFAQKVSALNLLNRVHPFVQMPLRTRAK
jgi:hypothetical protein